MMIIYTVDAFTNVPFRGNPAGVCLVEDFPQVETMQNIAMELSFANTAFAKKVAVNHYHIRWFTTKAEAPLCGHATIGTLHILAQENLIDINREVKFESLSGPLTGIIKEGWYTLNFPAYLVQPVELTDNLRAVVNHMPNFIGFGENCYLMEFASADHLKSLCVNLNQLKTIDCRALIATAKGDIYDFHSRYFAPRVGIDEDPVCASAHCRLIPYWAAKIGKNILSSYQLSSRGGELRCQNLGTRVLITGQAVTVMRSELTVKI